MWRVCRATQPALTFHTIHCGFDNQPLSRKPSNCNQPSEPQTTLHTQEWGWIIFYKCLVFCSVCVCVRTKLLLLVLGRRQIQARWYECLCLCVCVCYWRALRCVTITSLSGWISATVAAEVLACAVSATQYITYYSMSIITNAMDNWYVRSGRVPWVSYRMAFL